MGFLLVPKSMTLNDLEQRNGRVVCLISPKSVAFGAYYLKLVEDTPTHSVSEIYPKESSF